MEIQMSKTRDAVSEQQLTDIESKLDLQLPAEYKEFLLMYNGGRPKPGGFLIQVGEAKNRSLVDFFFCIKEGDIYDLVKYHKRLKNRVPDCLLPIATDPFGNIICLSVSGPSYGKVYFWDHEEETEEGEAPRCDNVYLISDTFNDFLKNLTDFA